MNLYKREIYKKSLQHAERRNHKYLYKIGDRYIYPEDVAAGRAKSTSSNIGSVVTAAGTAAKTKISNTIADQKTKLKDKKYLRDESHRKYPNLEKANVTSPSGKRVNQITSAHQEGTKKTTALSYQSTHDPISNKVVKVKRDFDANGDQIGVGYSTESSHIGKKKKYNEKSKDAGFQAEMERRQATINARNAKDRKPSDFANLTKAERDTAERKKSREASTKNTEQQRKSAHAGYELDKAMYPDGGSTEELGRQKKKTKARKSASKRFNELDQKNKRSSNSMEPDIQKQHSQINSAHQMATERRMAGNKHSDREWNRQNLYSVNYYDQSGSIERQKRKTALRKRHKK